MRKMKDSGIEWIGDIPQEWNLKRLKFLADNLDTYRQAVTANQRNQEAEVLYDYYGASGAIDKIDGYTIDDHVMLIGEDGANLLLRNLPLMYEVNGKAWINNHAHILKPKQIIDFYYLFYTLESSDIRPFITGSAQPKLNQEKMNNIPLPYPPLPEQQAIAAYLDRKCSEIDALVTDIQNEIETLEEYKRSVISEAVTKGLDPDVEMKDSGVEWIGDIPADWKMRKARYMFVQRFDKGNLTELQLLSPTQNYGVIPQWKYEELSGMVAVKMNERADLMQFKTVHKGDYCISLRSFQGGFEYSEYEGVVSPAYQVFYPVVRIDDRYYKYMFKDRGFIEKMNSYTMTLRDGKNISFFDFGNTYIPYPPVEKQQAIAAYLDRKCSEIDSIINEKQQQLETLAEYKKSLIYEYVTGKKEVINGNF